MRQGAEGFGSVLNYSNIGVLYITKQSGIEKSIYKKRNDTEVDMTRQVSHEKSTPLLRRVVRRTGFRKKFGAFRFGRGQKDKLVLKSCRNQIEASRADSPGKEFSHHYHHPSSSIHHNHHHHQSSRADSPEKEITDGRRYSIGPLRGLHARSERQY